MSGVLSALLIARGGGADAGMNTRRTAKKLQMALCQKGRFVKINQFQNYSERAERMVTKFVVSEKRETPTGRKKDFVILETYRMADVVVKLAEMYGETNDA